MPELPEVEIAARQLRAWAKGRRIVRAVAARGRVIRGQPPQRFAALAGHTLEEVERRGKWMLLRFDGGEGLVSHLGMTGKWMRRGTSEAPPSHVRATLELDDGHVLDYRDPRMFGRLVRGKAEALRKLPGFAALGPEPLPAVDVALLQAALARTRRSLKEALMDQRTLAGLGNIHVSESLYRAGLHPERPARTLDGAEAQALADSIVASLRSTLTEEDSLEPITYVEEGGENFFLVYDHEGEPCQRCGTEIARIVQGGRSTFYCRVCQPRGKRWLQPPAAPGKAAHAPKAAPARGRNPSPPGQAPCAPKAAPARGRNPSPPGQAPRVPKAAPAARRKPARLRGQEPVAGFGHAPRPGPRRGNGRRRG